MQRHAWLAIGAVAVAMVYGVFLSMTFTVETDVDSGQTIDIQQREQKPMTVTVTPGGEPGFADAQAQEPDGIAAPDVQRENEGFLISTLRPFFPVVAPLVGALWLLSRVGASARGKLAELNFGVYKGPMPYEMITARRQKLVFTHRQVEEHIFGKAREDFLTGTYLLDPPISVRRLLGSIDVEEADITRLRHGAQKNPVRAAARRPVAAAPHRRPGRMDPLVEKMRDAWDEEGVSGVNRFIRMEYRRRQDLRRRVRKAHLLNKARRQDRVAENGSQGQGS